jgi:hypothetical protein
MWLRVRTHLVTSFRVVYDSVLRTKLTFLTDKAWNLRSGHTSAQNNRYWSIFNPKRALEMLVHDRKTRVWYAIKAT